MNAHSTLDATDQRLAIRLAKVVADQRRQLGLTVRALAKESGGEFTPGDLRLIEAGRMPLTPRLASSIAALYDVDLTAISRERLPLVIQGSGVVSSGGHATSFDPSDVDSLLGNYLRLVRTMRGAERTAIIDLRRSDIDTLSEYLEMSGAIVVERLARLMGATRQQRRALAGTFLAGALVISLSGVAAAGVAGAAFDINDGAVDSPVDHHYHNNHDGRARLRPHP
jgi:hypothetical protein